jgi:hypothetical protein
MSTQAVTVCLHGLSSDCGLVHARGGVGDVSRLCARPHEGRKACRYDMRWLHEYMAACVFCCPPLVGLVGSRPACFLACLLACMHAITPITVCGPVLH